MKKLIALMAVVFLMTSAIPRERKSSMRGIIKFNSAVDRKSELDSLEVSIIELNKVLNQ